MQKPSINYIDTVENPEIDFKDFSDIHALTDLYPCFRMLEALIANMTISKAHIVPINTKSPAVKYRELLLKHPDWIKRFPQMQIASFIGMTRETPGRVSAGTTRMQSILVPSILPKFLRTKI